MKTLGPVKKILSVFIFLIWGGCLYLLYYDVKINGYLNSNEISSGEKVFVIGNFLSKNSILEDEVRKKIEKALEKNGFKITYNINEAAYILWFKFGVDSGQTYSYTDTYSYTSEETRLNIFSGQLEPVTKTHVNSYPVTRTVYTKSMKFYLYDSVSILEIIKKIEQGKTPPNDDLNKIKPLWVEEIISRGKGSDLRQAMDYLIFGGFEHFGQDTGKEISHLYFVDDEEVKALVN